LIRFLAINSWSILLIFNLDDVGASRPRITDKLHTQLIVISIIVIANADFSWQVIRVKQELKAVC
jgi:hypothetical protein